MGDEANRHQNEYKKPPASFFFYILAKNRSLKRAVTEDGSSYTTRLWPGQLHVWRSFQGFSRKQNTCMVLVVDQCHHLLEMKRHFLVMKICQQPWKRLLLTRSTESGSLATLVKSLKPPKLERKTKKMCTNQLPLTRNERMILQPLIMYQKKLKVRI